MSQLKATSTVKYESDEAFNEAAISNDLLNCSLHLVCLDCLCCFNQKSPQKQQPALEKVPLEPPIVESRSEVVNISPKPVISVISQSCASDTSSIRSGGHPSDHSPNIAQRRRHILLPKIQTKFIDHDQDSIWYDIANEPLPQDDQPHQSVIQLRSFEIQPRASFNKTLEEDPLVTNIHSPTDSSTEKAYTFDNKSDDLFCPRRRSTIEISNNTHANSILYYKRNTSSQEDICARKMNTLHIGSDCPLRRFPYPKTAQNLEEEKELKDASHVIERKSIQNISKQLMEEFTKMPTNLRNIKNYKGIDHKSRNRYIANIPIEETRIHLPPREGESRSTCVYINANLVMGHPQGPGNYIATEGPILSTIDDFWLLAWHSKCPCILMLTELNENKKSKCELYLPTLFSNNVTCNPSLSSGGHQKPMSVIRSDTEPSKPSDELTIDGHNPSPLSNPAKKKSVFTDRGGSARVNNQITVDIECIAGAEKMYGDINVKIIDFDKREKYSVREILLTYKGENRRIFHIWMSTWKDHTGGPNSQELFNVIKEIRKIRCDSKIPGAVVKDMSLSYQSKPRKSLGHLWTRNKNVDPPIRSSTGVETEHPISPSDGPMIVHCSAGLGRTGCFIAIDIGYDQLVYDQKVDIMKTVSNMRLQRGGLVETFEQYEYIYQTLTTLAQLEFSEDQQKMDQ